MTNARVTHLSILGIHNRNRSRPKRKGQIFVVSAFLILFSIASTSHGDVFPVTKSQDTNDGTCNADCSLREAIQAAAANPGADEITLGVGRFYLTIPGAGEDEGATGDLDLKGVSVSITGQGPGLSIIDASALSDRPIDVRTDSGATVTLEALTVAGGDCPEKGGGINHYQGHLVLDNVVVRDNVSAGSGGGIHCSPTADLTVQGASIIRDNACSTSWYGGGIMCQLLTITDSTVSANLGGSGGGIASLSGTVTISGSTIAYNQTENYDGGAIYTEGGVIAISNSTLVGNYSGRQAGAIYASVAGSSVTLEGVTMSGNNASTGGYSMVAYNFADVVFSNTLISGTCTAISDGTFSSSGGNMESPGNTCGLTGPGDDVNIVDPMLAPLGSYGGPTRTAFPLVGSPVLDNGLNAQCLGVDQRGEQRNDGGCDVGAVERQAGELDPIFVDGFESGDMTSW